MNKKHRSALVNGIVVICMLLTLCSCARTDKACTLTFASWYKEEDTLAYRDIAEKYNEIYPNVTVEFVTLDKPDNDFIEYAKNIKQAIDEGSIDLALLHPSIMTLIYEEGLVGSCLADVSQSPLFQQYSSSIQQLMTGADGTAYGYPSFMSFAGLLVNTDLLEACGISELPATYSEWVESMAMVKQAGHIPFASFDGTDSSAMFLISAMAQSELLYGSVSPDADPYEIFSPAIIKFAHLMDAGLLEAPGTALIGGTGREIVTQAFPTGNVAYTICPSWYVPALKEAPPDFKYQLTAIPASDRGSVVTIRAGWPVGVSASSTQQDEALRFLSYALLPENMELLAESKGNVSPLKNNTTSDEFYRDVLTAARNGFTYSDSVDRYGFDIVDTFNHIGQQLHSGVPLNDTLADFKSMLEHIE